MLRNRHFQVKMVKDGETPGTMAVTVPNPILLDVNRILENHLDDIVKGVVVVMVARKVLNTTCELILIKAGK